MTDAQMDDLKNFLRVSVVNELQIELNELRIEMRESFAHIADIITGHNDQLDNHETRISTLERKPI